MNKNELQEKANGCYCKSEFAYAIGKTYYNGRIGKQIDELIEKLQIEKTEDFSKKLV